MQKKIKDLLTENKPKDLKELRRLLSMAGFVRHLVRNCAMLTGPLSDVVAGLASGKHERLADVWTEEHTRNVE